MEKGPLIAAGISLAGVIGGVLAVLTYLNAVYVSVDKFDGHIESFKEHIVIFGETKANNEKTLERLTNRIMKKMKDNRIANLKMQQEVVRAKGVTNLSDLDEAVISILQTEIDTLQGR